MSKINGLLVLMLVLIMPGYAICNENREASDNSWHVISADSLKHLQTAFPLESKIGNKSILESLSIEKDRVKLCLLPENRCVFLVHPDTETDSAFKLGFGAEKLKADEKQAIVKAITKIPKTIWKTVKRENQSLFGLDRGYANAIWYLLQNTAKGYARRLIESLEKYEKDKVGIKLFKVIVLSLDDETDEARKIVSQLKKNGHNSPLVLLTDGMVDAFEDEIDEGAQKINDSLSDLPKGSLNRCNTANLLPFLMAKNGRQIQAISVWKAIEKKMPDCSLVIVSHAKQLLDWGKNDQALELINNSLKNDPKDIDKLVAKASILRRLKNIPEALKIVSQVNDIKPNDHEIISLHSTMASTMTHLDTYLNKMLERVKKSNKDLFAKHAAAVMSYYHGDFERSLKLTNEVIKEMPENSRARIYNSMSKYQLGDWEGALKGIQKLEEMGTDDPDLYYCYAMIWSGKDTNKARIYLEQYLAHPVSPDSVPEKQQRAWKEWKSLKDGVPPKAWQPGEEYPTKVENRIEEEEGRQCPAKRIVIALLLIALGFFAAGYIIGRKK